VTAAERLTTPDILAFAGIEPVTVAAIPLELHVAEKLHAYTRTYEGSRLSTRAKDLVDLALIAELSPLKATLLGTRSRPPSLAATPTQYPAGFHRRRRTGEARSVNWRKPSASQPSSPTLTPMPPPCSTRSSRARSGQAPGSPLRAGGALKPSGRPRPTARRAPMEQRARPVQPTRSSTQSDGGCVLLLGQLIAHQR
jgi:hypothetical protein